MVDRAVRVGVVFCTVIGAWTLLSLLVLGIWIVLVERARRMAQSVPSAGATAADGLGRERRARTWDDVPGWVARDREWAVAVVLLGAPAVAERTHRYVDFARRAIDWPRLLTDATDWPEDDRLLVYTAFDLAASDRDAKGMVGRHVTLHQLLEVDDQVAERVQAAVDVRRGRCDYLTAVSRAGGLG